MSTYKYSPGICSYQSKEEKNVKEEAGKAKKKKK